MGMYDTLKINVAQLPISDEEKAQWQAANVEFQTKSLERRLATYTITEDGFLNREDARWVLDDDEDPASDRVRLADAHGRIYFYTYIGNEYVEFLARFREGRLTDLSRSERETGDWARLCVWEEEIPISDEP